MYVRAPPCKRGALPLFAYLGHQAANCVVDSRQWAAGHKTPRKRKGTRNSLQSKREGAATRTADRRGGSGAWTEAPPSTFVRVAPRFVRGRALLDPAKIAPWLAVRPGYHLRKAGWERAHFDESSCHRVSERGPFSRVRRQQRPLFVNDHICRAAIRARWERSGGW